jgi:hypothetical protein
MVAAMGLLCAAMLLHDGGEWNKVFEAVKICHLAAKAQQEGQHAGWHKKQNDTTKITSAAAPVLALNWSPWYSCFEAPGGQEVVMGDPRERGSEESSYLAEWRTRLQLYKDWVAEANAVLGSNVSVGAALLDSERFWFNCSESPPWGAAGRPDGPYAQYCNANASFNKEWFDAITRKHDLTTGLVRSVFGDFIDIE